MNAKEEFLEHTKGHRVKCAVINAWNTEGRKEGILPVGYTKEDLEMFLNQLDFDYNDGFGSQNLFGTIWYMQEYNWSSRGEYDGSEWWDYNGVPEITKELMGDPDSRN